MTSRLVGCFVNRRRLTVRDGGNAIFVYIFSNYNEEYQNKFIIKRKRRMDRVRRPRQFYERWQRVRKPAKQRIHEILRQDPTLDIDQVVRLVGCPRGYARTWRRNFFLVNPE